MEQSASARPLWATKKVMGERNRRSQRVGMSFTSMKKAVKITRIRARLPRKSTPVKLRLLRFPRLPRRPPATKRRKRATRSPQPTRGLSREICGCSGG